MKNPYIEPEMKVVSFEDGIACNIILESDPEAHGPWSIIDEEDM